MRGEGGEAALWQGGEAGKKGDKESGHFIILSCVGTAAGGNTYVSLYLGWTGHESFRLISIQGTIPHILLRQSVSVYTVLYIILVVVCLRDL